MSIGCLVTSAVLSSGLPSVESPIDNSTLGNLSLGIANWEPTKYEYCGANFCPWTYAELLQAEQGNVTGNNTGDIVVDSGVDDVTVC